MTRALDHTVSEHKALAHQARIRIVAMLRDGELCACQVTAVLDLAASTVSAHLAELRRAGLLAERKEGRWIHYSLNRDDRSAALTERVWRQVVKDPQVIGDAAIVKQLRKVPVEELCGADLDLNRLSIRR